MCGRRMEAGKKFFMPFQRCSRPTKITLMIFPLFWSRSPGKGERGDRVPVLCFASLTVGDPEGDKSHQANRCHTSHACFKHCRGNTGLPICFIWAGLMYCMLHGNWRIFSEFLSTTESWEEVDTNTKISSWSTENCVSSFSQGLSTFFPSSFHHSSYKTMVFWLLVWLNQFSKGLIF